MARLAINAVAEILLHFAWKSTTRLTNIYSTKIAKEITSANKRIRLMNLKWNPEI